MRQHITWLFCAYRLWRGRKGSGKERTVRKHLAGRAGEFIRYLPGDEVQGAKAATFADSTTPVSRKAFEEWLYIWTKTAEP